MQGCHDPQAENVRDRLRFLEFANQYIPDKRRQPLGQCRPSRRCECREFVHVELCSDEGVTGPGQKMQTVRLRQPGMERIVDVGTARLPEPPGQGLATAGRQIRYSLEHHVVRNYPRSESRCSETYSPTTRTKIDRVTWYSSLRRGMWVTPTTVSSESRWYHCWM